MNQEALPTLGAGRKSHVYPKLETRIFIDPEVSKETEPVPSF